MNRDNHTRIGEFAPDAKQAVYDVIALRRDIRNFRPDAIPDDVLRRVLEAAHRAPSVGLMQPWDFILLRTSERKASIYELFRRATELASQHYDGDRRATYGALKLQGILDAPLCICVTCDTTRGGEHVLGRASIPETDRYSSCLAVENLWLAARAEGLGVGWVSIVDNTELARALDLPSHVVPIAFLCVGYPVEFPEHPMLETTGWRERTSLDALLHDEHWGGRSDANRVAVRNSEFDREMVDESIAKDSHTARSIETLAAQVHEADPGALRATRIRKRLDALAMPNGSMSLLEQLSIRLATAQGRDGPTALHRRVIVFAGDHGVTANGVSAFRADVTARLCYNMVAGGAVVNALLRTDKGTHLTVVDVGVDHAFSPDTRLRHSKVRRGTGNISVEAAMTRNEAIIALEAGAAAVNDIASLDVVVLGEVGIGNTSPASALLAMLVNKSAEEVTGAGTGIGPRAHSRKAAAIAAAIERDRIAIRTATVDSGNSSDVTDAIDTLASLGGLEIAAIAGAIIAAAARRIPIVLDGFITGVAALLATRLAPAVKDYLVASHQSSEKAHALVLNELGLSPLLQLQLRLGEASGGVLALPVVRAACALLSDVRTFEEAGIDMPIDERGLA